ncbi:MAG: glutathione S-transferase family protein [Deltaproteobacteria bacterium]|nr:glutathione S-transferase family protein [Deltaproteobacteria bacterium]
MSGRKIVVYGPPGSPFVEKVFLGLALKGFGDAELIAPQSPEDYRRWSPETGMLPLMDFEGTRVPDSSGILDWLDARFPDPPLVARDAWVARQQRQLESWIGETFFFYWVRWLRANVAPADPGAGSGSELARLGVLGRIAELMTGPPERAGEFDPGFERRLDDLVGFLGARPFFHADRPSRADLTATAFLGTLEAGSVPGGPRLLRARPALVALRQRVREATGR